MPKYSITHKAETEHFFTVSEIAAYINASEAQVRNIAAYYNIDKQVVRSKETRRALYTYNNVQLIKKHFLARKHKSEQEKIKPVKVESIASELDHPLVTDKRYLELNYWPETI